MTYLPKLVTLHCLFNCSEFNVPVEVLLMSTCVKLHVRLLSGHPRELDLVKCQARLFAVDLSS